MDSVDTTRRDWLYEKPSAKTLEPHVLCDSSSLY